MSTVHFVDARARRSSESLLEKLSRMIRGSELAGIVSPGDRVFVKCHMGAPLATRYLRPVYVRRIVEEVKALGGKPVVVETTGLGLLDPRGTAEKYLRVGASHGYTPEVLGAPLLIADGERGLHVLRTKVDGLKLRQVSLAGALKEADVLLGLAHFKGHQLVGVGGATKNIAIGLCSKEGKFNLHYEHKPRVDTDHCNSCGECQAICPANGAVSIVAGKAKIDPEACAGCLACVTKCEARAITANRRADLSELQPMIADMLSAVVNTVGRENTFFVNFLLEVDWLCDCEHGEQGWSDTPIVPDIGIVASTDPVALDAASVELVNSVAGMPGSKADEVHALQPGVDKFRAIFPRADWRAGLLACERLGVGKTTYQLVRVQ